LTRGESFLIARLWLFKREKGKPVNIQAPCHYKEGNLLGRALS